MIKTAAILMRDGKLLSLPRPARHHDLIWYAIHILGYDAPVGGRDNQGFVAHMANEKHPKFVERLEARKIAEDNDQLIPRAIDNIRLFSEDVWEGMLDRDEWLRKNPWQKVNTNLPNETDKVWYFSEYVGVFEGYYRGYNNTFEEYTFGGIHGSVDATHWMPYQDEKPDAPWVRYSYVY